MKYIGKEDAIYTSAGTVTLSAFIILFSIFASWGVLGWVLNVLILLGTGAILGQFIQTWHIDYKFERELDGFEEHLQEALHLKKKSDDSAA